MNLKFSLTKEYFQVLSLTIIIFYTFFTHTTTKSDMILLFAQRMDYFSIDLITYFAIIVSRKRESHGKIFNVLSPAKLKTR